MKDKRRKFIISRSQFNRIYVILSILLITDLALYLFYGISLSGQLSDLILFWIWLILTPYIIVKNFRKKWSKFYLGMLILLLMMSLFPMGVPILTITAFAIDINGSAERKVQDYRLREGVKSVIAIPKINLIKDYGIIEKEIGESNFYIKVDHKNYCLENVTDIKLKEENDSLNFELKIGNQTTNRKFRK